MAQDGEAEEDGGSDAGGDPLGLDEEQSTSDFVGELGGGRSGALLHSFGGRVRYAEPALRSLERQGPVYRLT